MADFSFILDYISANFEVIVPRRTHRDGSLMLAKVNLDIDSNLMLSISIKYLIGDLYLHKIGLWQIKCMQFALTLIYGIR